MPAAGSFSAQVAAWAAKTRGAMLEVVRESARIAADTMTKPRGAGGRMPVVSGNLRNSLAASLAGLPTIDFTKGHKFNDRSQIEDVIRSAEPGHTIFLGFRAPYAEKSEFRDANGFWRITVQRWPAIVEQAAKNVQGGR